VSKITTKRTIDRRDHVKSIEELLNRIRTYIDPEDLRIVEDSFEFSYQAHSAQKRDDDTPYISHPLAVAGILADYRLDSATICAALLHDTIDDTVLTLKEIERRFGGTVAGLVDGVTKLNRLELKSNQTKQVENFRKLVLAMSKDIRILLVKLADRLHNMRTLRFVQSAEQRQRIARETMQVYAPIAERIGIDAIKSELQSISFRELEPEAYETINARLTFLRRQGADMIDEVSAELRRICEGAGISVLDVTGREKNSFSIWEEMRRRSVKFEALSDIMVFRIICETNEACYAALAAIHEAYPVIAGRFKDYISTPKANGYQSLHTGVSLREPRNQKIEIQIRTREMHEVARYGVAAGWFYNDGNSTSTLPTELDPRKSGWVQSLLDILESPDAEDDDWQDAKIALQDYRIFCFTPKGELIGLPRGATPVDFAYAVHSQVGDACGGAKVNGRLLPLRHELQNGDRVEILTTRGGTPSPQWERFVVTSKARARIRRFVLAQQREAARTAGRAALAKAFREEGVDGSELVLEPILTALNCSSLDDLYIAVGNNQLELKEVIHAAYPEFRAAAGASPMSPGLAARGAPLFSGRGETDRRITGLVAGMDVLYAGCCHPLPGDRIVGIIATGKGVTIHTKDCLTLESFAATPERFIDVDWDFSALPTKPDGKAALHTGRISVIAVNEPSSLANLTNAISKHEGAVANLKIVNRQKDFVEVLVDVDVRDLRHLSTVIAGLRGAAGVTQVERAKA